LTQADRDDLIDRVHQQVQALLEAGASDAENIATEALGDASSSDWSQ
jgi:hypothetical protein